MGEIHQDLREIRRIGTGTREFLIHPEHCPVLRQHEVALAGISHASAEFRFVRTVRPGMPRGQILVCFRGRGHVLVDGAWVACEAGHAYVTPPGVLHAYQAEEGWEVGWILYNEGHMGQGTSQVQEPVLVELDPRPLEHALWGLHQEISTHREPAMLDHWGEIVVSLGNRILEPWRTSRLWRLWRKVQADLGHAWSLGELAALSGLGAEQLRRVCVRETGVSPMQQVTRLRMQQAVSLISAGYKVEAVAQAVGYENAFAFSTAFRRHLGAPPSAFRGE
ncbi:helix-turn-helix transcriptional regulator [Geminisphaera colitermitum]|uniref:helix-turn-helix transcriptional regulator n=1 Tax=Geminisphaera colitermitum TaxID=1148786 RepID=UPI0001964DCB|nr:AraC family transcriptional regulator [Geminisphaera colitermitum]